MPFPPLDPLDPEHWQSSDLELELISGPVLMQQRLRRCPCPAHRGATLVPLGTMLRLSGVSSAVETLCAETRTGAQDAGCRLHKEHGRKQNLKKRGRASYIIKHTKTSWKPHSWRSCPPTAPGYQGNPRDRCKLRRSLRRQPPSAAVVFCRLCFTQTAVVSICSGQEDELVTSLERMALEIWSTQLSYYAHYATTPPPSPPPPFDPGRVTCCRPLHCALP